MLVVWRIGSIATGLAGLLACEEPGGMSGADASVAPRCSPTAAFGRATGFMALNTPNHDEQATLSADELTLYFSRDDGTGNYDIYQATRASKTATFGAATAVPGVSTTGSEERAPRVTADGLTMYATTRPIPTGASKFRVAFATRASTDAAFGPLQNVPVVNGTTNDSDPFITADGRTLYFSSDRNGTYALYRSTQTAGTFSAPELVMGTNLDTTSAEGAPVLSEDGLTLYLASARFGGLGMVDIFVATRATAQDPFGEPKAVRELNSPDPDVPSWLSADGCELYFTRYDPAKNFELAVALRGK
jgi:hypothetical protein